jgi:phosphohistidine phosphatase SixA
MKTPDSVSKLSKRRDKSNIDVMNVYLFRHGQKASLPFADPDLTATGFAQASSLARRIENGELLAGTHFWASPRIRAQNTFAAAAQLCKAPVQIVRDLDQREHFETSEVFRARIQSLLLGLEKKFASGDIVYLCTHHDWIEESLPLIPADTDLLDSRYWSWNPTQYMHFEVGQGVWQLRNFNRIEI